MTAKEESTSRGAISWMAHNPVTANLLMLAFLLGGLIMTTKIKQEVFPDLQLDFVLFSAPFPGASPEEVEEGILLAVEEEVRGLDDIKEVTSTAWEGIGSVVVELQLGADPNKALTDVKNAVDRIKTFPENMERYTVSLVQNRRHVVSMVLHGHQSEAALRQLAEKVRQDLIKEDDITQVELTGVRNPEIAIEVPQENLRRYNLTLDAIAGMIRQAALDMPGGRVKTAGGEVLVRTTERRYAAREYGNLPVITRNDGTRVLLKDIAHIRESFEDTDISATFNGEPAVRIDVYRVGDETPRAVSRAVHKHVEQLNATLPSTVRADVWEDMSEILNDRIRLLLKNAALGLVLVLILLGMTLDIRLAFWVTLGIPISILGAMLFFPAADLSINMISLFAIIVTIGIVVDDAVIVGENVFHHRQQGKTFLQAAIDGARQMATPVTFSILTNVAAFVPLLFVPGVTGKIFRVIPTAVIMIFLISLIEALFILPSHLSHKPRKEGGWIEALNRRRAWFGAMLEGFRDRRFQPALRACLKWRYLSVAVALFVLMICIGSVVSGRINFSFMPKIESDRVTAQVEMPYGTPVEQTRAVRDRLFEAAEEIIAENGGDDIIRGVYSQIGATTAGGGPVNLRPTLTGGHITNVSVYMVPVDQRDITAERFVKLWNQRVRDLVGIETLTFGYTTGPSSSQPVALMISHPNQHTLEKAAGEVAERLTNYAGVRDINDGFSAGKTQLDFRIKPSAQSLGVTAADLARQVRGAFYGAEALRIQRGRDEVKVLVRLPESERTSEYNLESLMIRTPAGSEIPIGEAATISRGTSYTEIQRSEGRRVLTITADVDREVTNADKVVGSMQREQMPDVLAKYPGLKMELEGEQEDKTEAMQALGFGFLLCLFAIYALLAIPFKSYSQPLIIMTSIPFGIIGAVIGHVVMGYELSVISMFGIIALAGVVVNDSLILVHTANRNRRAGRATFDSVFKASVRRFRPIVLTSLTTFLGLAPMIFETSLQARFLIPMAISLGFGILFATGIALILIPCLYLILDDVHDVLSVKKPHQAKAEAAPQSA